MKMSIGFDVSKQTIDAAFIDGENTEHVRVENNQIGYNRVLEKIRRYKAEEIILTMEATGVYHCRCASFFESLGFLVSVVNPLIIKRFADMKMSRAKTDKADAKLIAQYGLNQKTYEYKTPSKNRLKIQVFLKTIESLKQEKTQHRNRLEALAHCTFDMQEAATIHRDMIEQIDLYIKQLEKKIAAIVDEEYSEAYAHLLSIPGIGKRVAAAVLGNFGDMENFTTAKQLVGYIGLNSSPRESGTSIRGKGSISRKGNSYLRKLFFLASLSACKYNKSCRDLYERLIAKGKAKKVALIAVANKLVRQSFAIVKFNRAYNASFC